MKVYCINFKVLAVMLVTALASFGMSQSHAATVIHWDFDDGDAGGSTVTDLSGNGNHGTISDKNGTWPVAHDAGVYGVSEGWVNGTNGISSLDD